MRMALSSAIWKYINTYKINTYNFKIYIYFCSLHSVVKYYFPIKSTNDVLILKRNKLSLISQGLANDYFEFLTEVLAGH